MAHGDIAISAGMEIVPGTMDLRKGYDEINRTRDEIATHMLTGTHPASAISSGVFDAARIPDLPASRVTSGQFEPARLPGLRSNAGQFYWDGAAWISNGVLASLGNFQSSQNITAAGSISAGGDLGVQGAIFNPQARAVGVSGGLAVFVGADGRLGVSSSSRRFKREIQSWSPDRQALLALELVTFRFNPDYHGSDDAPLEFGLIAEDVDALGLTWLVYYDDAGNPLGVHYDRIALALLAVVQDHEARLAALEGK